MPQLPEVDSARRVVDRALHRTIVDVDDSDEFACRPHAPGDIRRALKGGQLVAAHRRGKSIWCDTVDASGDPGPALGIHLGMGGRIVVTGTGGASSGGDPVPVSGKAIWNRFALRFDDGDELRLLDKRRLGQLAQATLAGVGNLLADEALWRARLAPTRPAGSLPITELDELRRVLRAAIRRAIVRGGVHTGELIEHRRPGGYCPRCGAELVRATIGSRTTWWCPIEQH